MNEQLQGASCQFTWLDAATEVVKLIHRRLGTDIVELHVQLGERGLVLQGRARCYYAKQIAQHVAMHATGLPIQSNEIDVQ